MVPALRLVLRGRKFPAMLMRVRHHGGMQSSRDRESSSGYPRPATIVQPLVDHVGATDLSASRPIVVAIDGRSGSGKSTVAEAFVASLRAEHGVEAVVIGGDEFYAGRSAASWDARAGAKPPSPQTPDSTT